MDGKSLYGLDEKENEDGSIDIYHYNIPEFEGLAAHELGHALGLKDAYGLVNNGYELLSCLEIGYNKNYYCIPAAGEIMMCSGVALENDIEMVLQAAIENAWQFFVPNSKQNISKAIKTELRYRKSVRKDDGNNEITVSVIFMWNGKEWVELWEE